MGGQCRGHWAGLRWWGCGVTLLWSLHSFFFPVILGQVVLLPCVVDFFFRFRTFLLVCEILGLSFEKVAFWSAQLGHLLHRLSFGSNTITRFSSLAEGSGRVFGISRDRYKRSTLVVEETCLLALEAFWGSKSAEIYTYISYIIYVLEIPISRDLYRPWYTHYLYYTNDLLLFVSVSFSWLSLSILYSGIVWDGNEGEDRVFCRVQFKYISLDGHQREALQSIHSFILSSQHSFIN